MGKHSSSKNIFNKKVFIASGPDENLFGNCCKISFIVSQLNAISSFRKLLIIGTIGSLSYLFWICWIEKFSKKISSSSSIIIQISIICIVCNYSFRVLSTKFFINKIKKWFSIFIFLQIFFTFSMLNFFTAILYSLHIFL